MDVQINWSVNEREGNVGLTLEEMGVQSLEDWNELDEDEKKYVAQEALDTYDLVYPMVDDIEIKH